MKNNRSIKRRGFTLVELLIVIVVIGVLSAMMMLSSTEAVTSARASNIISNLRNMKTAATAMYVDHLDYATKVAAGKFDGNVDGSGNSMDLVVKYMNNGGNSSSASDASLSNYGIYVSGQDWYVYYEGIDSKVQEKLAGRAKSVGLTGGASTTNLNKTTAYTSGNVAGMWVLDLATAGTTTSDSGTDN